MAQNLIQAQGGQAQKPTRFVSLFTSRFLTGLYTNRSLLRGPLQSIYSEFYHLGATDALCDGLNSELTIRQTMVRRPGNPKFCTSTTAAAVDNFYSFHQSDGTIRVIADSSTDVEYVTPTSITSIFTKNAAAGEGYFQGIDKSLYISDGVGTDLVKYIPSGLNNSNTGKPVWSWGGVAPTAPPLLSTTETGSAGTIWVASVVYTSMGFLIDSNNNIQQLVGVNADTNNPNATQIGTSGAGNPTFGQNNGDIVVDGTVTWTSSGQIKLWSANTVFPYLTVIYDPTTNALYFQSHSGPSGSSGPAATKPHFNTGALGTATDDSGVLPTYQTARWRYLGQAPVWQPSHLYNAFPNSFPTTISANSFIITPTPATSSIVSAGTPALTVQFANVGGSSGTSTTYSGPTWAVAPGNPTLDGQLQWNCLGPKTRSTVSPAYAWSANASFFSAFVDPNGNYQVCIVGGTTNGTASAGIAWNTDFGSITTEPATGGGTGVQWSNCGPSSHTNTWVASTKWYLPSSGFNPPLSGQPWGGANVTANSVVWYVKQSGLSQTPGPPAWTAVNTSVTDNNVIWYGASSFNPNGFSWTKGYGYVFAYKARRATDPICTTAANLPYVNMNTPPNPQGLGAPTGCGDGTVTTASPAGVTAVGPNAGAINQVSGPGSADPQFDTVVIFRSADGFAASGPYLYLTECPMPPVINGAAGTWNIWDNMPDTASVVNGITLPGLNPLISAPVDHVNDPPPGAPGSTVTGSSIIGQVYHQGRLWAFIGNSVYASGGPDTDPGNGFTAWPPDQVFPFDSNVIRLIPTATALLVFTTTDVYIIGGGPAITDYYSQLMAPGVGILSFNAVTMVLGLPYMFTSDRQFVSIDPSGGFTRIGHPIGDKLVQYDPTLVYLTYHTFGDQDHALFISDGESEWYRCDPYPTPDSQITGPCWSPRATLSGGMKALLSVEVSPGVRKLLIGPPAAGFILNRDSTFSVFTDNGSAYESYFTMGCIVLAHPGQMAQCDFVEMDFVKTGTQPTVSVMFDELSPTGGAAFESISNSMVSDPPKLYGQTATPFTLWMNRYYFGQTTPGNGGDETPVPAWCKFLQLKVDFGNTDTVQNELLAFSIFGALYQEK